MAEIRKRRAERRDQYAESARKLCDKISSCSSSQIPKSELQKLGVDRIDFDPSDEAFVTSDKFFFEPLQELHHVNDRELNQEDSVLLRFEEFDPNKVPTTNEECLGMNTHERASLLYKYIENQLFRLPRQTSRTAVGVWRAMQCGI